MGNLGSNFQTLKAEFKRETKLDADTNLAMYIQYYGARMADLSFQQISKVLIAVENIDNKRA
jgi:hypothetical protein